MPPDNDDLSPEQILQTMRELLDLDLKAELTLPEPEDIEVTQRHGTTSEEEGQSPAEARERFMTEAEFERGVAAKMQHQYDRMSKALSNFSDRWKTDATPTFIDHRDLSQSLKDKPERLAQMEADWAYINSLQDYFESVEDKIGHAQSPEGGLLFHMEESPTGPKSVPYSTPTRAEQKGAYESWPTRRSNIAHDELPLDPEYTERAEFLEGKATDIDEMMRDLRKQTPQASE